MEDRIHENYEKYYQKIEKVGKGGFGEVWKAELKSDKNEIRALKFIDLNDIRQKLEENLDIDDHDIAMEKSIKDFKNEIKNMKLCSDENRNENSVRYYEYFESENELVIVMELCDTNLLKILAQNKEGFSTGEIFNIMNQLNKTFKIMRKNNIVHRDLKLENILVKYREDQDSDFMVKLSDYGISKKVTDSTMCKTHAGTSLTMAPEILKGEGNKLENGNDPENIKGEENNPENRPKKLYDEKCDLWSIGIMLYQLYFRNYPFKGNTEPALLNNIKFKRNKVITDKNTTGDKNLDDLIKRLLIEDPRERISWEDYFNHPFFGDVIYSEIIIKILVAEKDINKNIYFLENINTANKEEEKFKALNNDNTELYIDNNIQKEFSKFFKPSKTGEYTIKLVIKTKITNCNNMFYNCKNITSVDLTSFDSSEVTDTSGMFRRCFHLKEIIFGDFNTENVTNMKHMFAKCRLLEKIEFPKSFVTKNVTNMALMFLGCETLKEIKVLFDTSKVTNMRGLFQNCFLLQKLDLSTFRTDKVNDMSQMFYKCCQLTEIIIDLKNFKTTNVKNMSRMFSDCFSLPKFNFSGFATDNVEFMSEMFNRCEQMKDIDLSSFNTKNLKNMSYMFTDCLNLKKINLSSFVDKGDLVKENLFTNCKSLVAVKAETTVGQDFESNVHFKKL